jgi:hypothetical protein
MSDFVSVATYASSGEAHLARIALEAEGLRTVILNENTTNFMPDVALTPQGGIQLQVLRQDLERAKEILHRAQESRPSDDPMFAPEPGWDACPKCHSTDIIRTTYDKNSTRILIWALWFGFRRRRTTCKKCGHLWNR